MPSRDLSIVIVTFNSECKIRNLGDSFIKPFDAFFVDNASKDESFSIICEKFGDKNCIRLEENLGYARANNIALARVNTKYALVMNPDLDISKNSIEKLISVADSHPEYSLIGVSGHAAPSGARNAPIVDADFVSGSCMLFRMSDFSGIGFFDENFFMYFEDVDLCIRLKEAGYRMGIAEDSSIIHEEGTSTGGVSNSLLERFWIWGASSRYFYEKHKQHREGQRARRKIRQWQKRKIISFLLRDRRKYAEACARVKGYTDVKKSGPSIAFQNYFTGHEPRTRSIDDTVFSRPVKSA